MLPKANILSLPLMLFIGILAVDAHAEDMELARIAKMQAEPKWMVPVISAKLCRHQDHLRGMTLVNLKLFRHGLPTHDVSETIRDIESQKDQLKLFKSKQRPCRDKLILRLISCIPSINGDDDRNLDERCNKEPILSYMEADSGNSYRSEQIEIATEERPPEEPQTPDPEPTKGKLICTPRRTGGETCRYVPSPAELAKPPGS